MESNATMIIPITTSTKVSFEISVKRMSVDVAIRGNVSVNNEWNSITGNGDDFFFDGGGLECFVIAQTADFDSFASIYSAVPGNPNGSTYINLYVSRNPAEPGDGILNPNDHAYIDNLELTVLNTSSADVSGFTEKYGNAILWIGGTFLVFAFFLSLFRLWRKLRSSLSEL